jgi:hypothetical protein
MRMPFAVRVPALAGLLAALLAPAARADVIPDWLPHYDLGIRLDVANRKVTALQRVTFHNRHARPAEELTFNVHARYKMPDGEVSTLAKTLELLRAPPSLGIDSAGRRLTVHAVTLDGRELPFYYREDNQTALVVPLPRPVRQGESVTVEIAFTLDLPEKQGRWGHWKGVTFLANWYPVLAYYDDHGWQPTPFVAWHQPFFNEAGVYSVRLTLPADQRIASTGTIREEEHHGDGTKTAHIVGCAARDFAIVCSHRFVELVGQAEKARVRVLAFPEHEAMARKALEFACEAIPIYNRWFGIYPYDEFDIVESHFPWNGNECSGLIMIDERVFSMPSIGVTYLDHLVSHETLHQWWYNVVGTNGYCETWMDEGVVAYYTAKRLQAKYGKNAAWIQYPKGLGWLPNIHHEDYRFSGMYGTLARAEATPTVQPLPAFGNLVTLFSMTYDRGAKILGMIEARIGEGAFYDFMKIVYAKYQFRVLRVADFQRELEAYTGRSWAEFFANWFYGVGMTDWCVEQVEIDKIKEHPTGPFTGAGKVVRPGYRVAVRLRQKGEFTEPTWLGVCFDEKCGYELRIPVTPGGCVQTNDPPARVEGHPDGSVTVEMVLPRRPVQISVDPDQVLLDREPANNHWRPEVHCDWFTLESDFTTPYDRWALIAGPWFDQRGHVGGHAGVYRLQQFRGGLYAGYDVNDEGFVVGADGLLDHWPHPAAQFGFYFDHGLSPDWADTRRDQLYLFGRYVIHPTASLYMDPMEYIEVYGRWEQTFWEGDQYRRRLRPGVERYDDATAIGLRYHRDYFTPYWDPEAGYRLDVGYEHGFAFLGGDETYDRVEGEFAAVKGLPDGLGWLSQTRVAARVWAGYGWPENGEHFQLGGARHLRGLERIDRQGNAVWLASLEWRVPLWTDMDCDLCGRVARVRHLYAAAFYDVGAIYRDGHSVDDIAHSFGAGLRFDVAIFSFVERTTLRLDVAKVINDSTPVQVWFGFQHPF